MQYKGYNTGFEVSTPNISVSEGLRPAQHYAVASYLRLERFDNRSLDYKVISHGKVVAVDTGNFIVPAGLLFDIERAIVLGSSAWDSGNLAGYSNYKAVDVTEGVKDFGGVTAVADTPIITSFFGVSADLIAAANALGTQVNFVTGPIGLAPQDLWRQNGAGYGQGYSAADSPDFTFANYNMQQGTTVWTQGFVQVPVVTDLSGLIIPGIVVYMGTPSLVPGLVSYNADSNFVPFSSVAAATPIAGSTFTAGSAGNPTDAEIIIEIDRVTDLVNAQDIKIADGIRDVSSKVIGRLLFMDDKWDKDLLAYVKTWEPNSTLGKPATPGASTLGLPDSLWLAGEQVVADAKMVRINFSIK